MNNTRISVLNIGLDRDLLARDRQTEAQLRQQIYGNGIPAQLRHLVKAPADFAPAPFDLDANVRVIPCPVVHWSLFPLAAFRAGSRELNCERADIIQVQDPYLSGLAGALLARQFGIPLVVGVFSDEVDNPVWLRERWLNRLASALAKWVLRRAAAVRVDSRAVVDRLAGYGYRILTYVPFLITNAAGLTAPNEKAGPVRQRLLEGRAGPLLFAACRLEPEKNIPLMLRAVGEAAKTCPELVLAIAGSGNMAEELAALGRQVAPNRVRWLGRVENADMPAYYQAADLTLLSSDRESAARVLTESLLAGTAVVTTATAGASEVVEDGISGRVVPVGDVRAFADALIGLCGDAARMKAMGQEGQKRMEGRATGEAVLRDLRELYARVLGAAA